MATGKPADPRKFKFIEMLSSVCFGIVVFIFFAFFYDHHLLFIEQLQFFLLTGTHFFEKLVLPGGFNGWIGDFLTQFYYIPLAGALIIALLLVAIQMLTNSVLCHFNQGRNLYPLTFPPAMVSGFILCSELFPLSATTGLTFALAAAFLYTRIKIANNRFIAGIILIPGTYYLLGGAYMSTVLIMEAYELIALRRPAIKHTGTKQPVSGSSEVPSPDRLKTWQCLICLLLAAFIPFLIRQFIIFQPVKQAYLSEFYYNIPDKIPPVIPILFIIPFLLTIIPVLIPGKLFRSRYFMLFQVIIVLVSAYYGTGKWIDPEAEEIMTYDHLAKSQQWDDLIEFAGKKPPGNFLSLAMLNLSLAKKDQLGDKMFNYSQHGTEGLFLRFDKEFISPMMGNEILYHLGLINASQEYAFESMEVMPNMEKSVRAIKRIAETNLINGQYKVSEKYLKLLEKTLFYRKWAQETREYLYNEEMINNHPEWGEKRRFMMKEDYFFHMEDIEIFLQRLLRENPGNRNALEYLAATYLLKREMDAFAGLLPLMEKMNYNELPVSFQEAFLLYRMVTNRDPLTGSSFRISQNIRSAMDAYAKVYLNNKDARNLLSRFYSGTYWYYFHFAE